MAKAPQTKHEIRSINRPDAPEIFVNEYPLLWLWQGNVNFTFATARPDHTTKPTSFDRVVVGRVTMPVAAAKGLAINLWAFLQANGIDPSDKPAENEPVQ